MAANSFCNCKQWGMSVTAWLCYGFSRAVGGRTGFQAYQWTNVNSVVKYVHQPENAGGEKLHKPAVPGRQESTKPGDLSTHALFELAGTFGQQWSEGQLGGATLSEEEPRIQRRSHAFRGGAPRYSECDGVVQP